MTYKLKLTLLIVGLFISLTLTSPVKAAPAKGVHLLFPEEINSAVDKIPDLEYVVIPISISDWEKIDKWQTFMLRAQKLGIKPILRLTSRPAGSVWTKPKLIDAIDWANFLSLLDWPEGDRWVIIFNEPNHAAEWGGVVNPYEYAAVLKEFSIKLKTKDQNFKILPAALDMAAGSTKQTQPALKYWQTVFNLLPEINTLIDGWNAHAYPNPAFASRPYVNRPNNIASYRYELELYRKIYNREFNKPIFITETGWSGKNITEAVISNYLRTTWEKVWSNDDIKMVSWFIFNGWPGPFEGFSLLKNGQPTQVLKTWSALGS